MPLFFQQDINGSTRLAVWRILEDETFFLRQVPLQREITHPHKRLQHLAGRYLLQLLYPDFPMELIRIADTHRPFVADDSFHFSISHCGDTAAAIVSRSERVGIDVETATQRILRIRRKFLHPEEDAWVDDVDLQVFPDRPDDKRFSPWHLPTLLWSAKEAVFKWHGDGAVDFSEHIRIRPFNMQMAGLMEASFRKDGQVGLSLDYRWLDDTCLCWLKA